MAYAHGCCCCGGCNVWRDITDNSPCIGFGDDDDCMPVDCGGNNQGGRCGEYGNDGNSWQECCGPATPKTVRFSADTHWAFAWHRAPHGMGCMGTHAPELFGAPHQMPTAKWSCIGEPDDKQVAVWDVPAGSVSSGAWWVDAGAINMILRKDNETAAATSPDNGGANWPDHPAGCCAHHYYGKVDLAGPATPELDENPWGYTGANYANGPYGSTDRVGAPDQLEALGHLSLETGGWATNSDSNLPPTLVMRATLSIFVTLKGTINHYVDINASDSTYYAHALGLVTYSSAVVGGCSCGSGIDLTEGLDWTNPSGGSWGYKWPYPNGSDAQDTINYTDDPTQDGCGGIGGPYCCGSTKGVPNACTPESFTLFGYEGAASNALLACQKSWAFLAGDPLNPTRKKNATKVWAYPETQSSAGGMPTPGTFSYASNNAYGLGAGVSSGNSWFCIVGEQTDYCYCYDCSPTSHGSNNTHTINGGFTAGNHSIYNTMPTPGLTNVVIGIGNGNLE